MAGHVEIVRDLPSPEGFARTVRIYTPAAYDGRRDERFPVLYMQDGQNVFEHPASGIYDTWRANTVLEELVASGAVEPWIIVGVDSGPGRFSEYSPWDEPRAQVIARGEQYAGFFLESLLPFVSRNYRVREGPEWTGVVGSSLGGLISLYLGWRYGDHFGRVGAFSPTVMWSQGWLREHWTERKLGFSRLYLDAGEAESIESSGIELDYGRATRAFGEHLSALGYSSEELRVILEPGGQHHERDWQRRLPSALQWLLR